MVLSQRSCAQKLESIEEGGEQKFGLEVTTGGTTCHCLPADYLIGY